VPPPDPAGQRRQRVGGARPRHARSEPAAPAAAEQSGDDTRERALRRLQPVDDPVFRLGPGLDQGHPRARQIPQGLERRRRDTARTHAAVGQALRHPARSCLVGLVPGAPPPLLRRAHQPPHRAHQDVGDRTPINAGALQRDDRALRRGQPRAPDAHGLVGGCQLTHRLGHLTVRVDPAPTGPELRLMDGESTADRRHAWPDTSRLSSNGATAARDTGAFGEGYAHPPRDALGSPGGAAVSSTDRFGSGVSPRHSDNVLFPVPASPLDIPEPGMRR